MDHSGLCIPINSLAETEKNTAPSESNSETTEEENITPDTTENSSSLEKVKSVAPKLTVTSDKIKFKIEKNPYGEALSTSKTELTNGFITGNPSVLPVI